VEQVTKNCEGGAGSRPGVRPRRAALATLTRWLDSVESGYLSSPKSLLVFFATICDFAVLLR
jgi:hypothetical protein